MAIHEDHAVVGSVWDEDGRGSVYVYKQKLGENDNNVWVEEGKFTAAADIESGSSSSSESDDQFGWSVDIYENTIAVGAFGHDGTDDGTNTGNNNNSGAVYLFNNQGTGGGWKQQTRLVPPSNNSKAYDHFGRNVRLYEDWLVVSAPFDDSAGGYEAGAISTH